MWQHLNGHPMSIFGDGEQTRAFSHIDDILEPLWLSAVLPSASKQIINLGGTTFHSINEANNILKKVIGGGETVYLEPRHEVKDAYPTWDKSVRILSYKDKVGLEEGLFRMWNWVKEQKHRHRLEWPVYEVEKGIYNFWKND